MLIETITWYPVAERLPDADLTVLIKHGAPGEDEVTEGFLDGETWRYAESGGTCPLVRYWAEMPEGPKTEADRRGGA